MPPPLKANCTGIGQTDGPVLTALKLTAGGSLVVGRHYSYEVAAVFDQGLGTFTQSRVSHVKTVVPTSSKRTAELHWTPVPGAAFYNVYRYDDAPTSVGLLAAAIGASYSDAGGRTDTTQTPDSQPQNIVGGGCTPCPVCASIVTITSNTITCDGKTATLTGQFNFAPAVWPGPGLVTKWGQFTFVIDSGMKLTVTLTTNHGTFTYGPFSPTNDGPSVTLVDPPPALIYRGNWYPGATEVFLFVGRSPTKAPYGSYANCVWTAPPTYTCFCDCLNINDQGYAGSGARTDLIDPNSPNYWLGSFGPSGAPGLKLRVTQNDPTPAVATGSLFGGGCYPEFLSGFVFSEGITRCGPFQIANPFYGMREYGSLGSLNGPLSPGFWGCILGGTTTEAFPTDYPAGATSVDFQWALGWTLAFSVSCFKGGIIVQANVQYCLGYCNVTTDLFACKGCPDVTTIGDFVGLVQGSFLNNFLSHTLFYGVGLFTATCVTTQCKPYMAVGTLSLPGPGPYINAPFPGFIWDSTIGNLQASLQGAQVTLYEG